MTVMRHVRTRPPAPGPRMPAELPLDPEDAHAEDRRIREEVLAGSRDAAEALFERHMDALYEFVHYRVGRDASRAEDVVQDTLLVALDRLVDFDGRSSLHTWLCGIARNKIRAERRRQRPARLEDLLDECDPAIDAILAEVEREPLPDAVLEARETSEMVGAALSSLPPDYRVALVEKYVEGRSVPEMARDQGRHVKAVESRLHRARLAFARVLELLARRRGGRE